MTETTIDKVRAYKNGDKSAIEALLKQYEPLIKSYSRNFGTREMEDAEQELRIALYSAVEQIDQVDMEAKVVNYLVKAVKSRFIYLYGKHRKRIESETVILEDMDFEVHENAYEDMIFYTDMSEYSKKLPEQQRVILQGILTGKDDKEIATELNVSRQYVNRIKKKMFSGENIF